MVWKVPCPSVNGMDVLLGFNSWMGSTGITILVHTPYAPKMGYKAKWGQSQERETLKSKGKAVDPKAGRAKNAE